VRRDQRHSRAGHSHSVVACDRQNDWVAGSRGCTGGTGPVSANEQPPSQRLFC